MAENHSSTYLTRTADTPTNTKKYTMSVWVKPMNYNTGDYNYIISSDAGSARREHITFEDGTAPFFKWYHRHSDNTVANLSTTAVFNDHSGWWHIVVAFDSTLATAADRVKIYINGSRVTSFRTETHIVQNTDSNINSSDQAPKIGMIGIGTSGAQDGAFNGIMSHFHFCDGYCYDASAFGETDAQGEWKIKTSPSVSYGANGYFIFKDKLGLTDQSGNSNDWTANGTGLTTTEDNPSNNFNTWNGLWNAVGYHSSNAGGESGRQIHLKFGCTGSGYPSSAHATCLGTMATDKMPFYYECYLEGQDMSLGIMAARPTGGQSHSYNDATCYGVYPYSGSSNWITAGSWTSQTVFTGTGYYMVAVDPTNNKMWVGKDGTWDGDPSAGTGERFTLAADKEWTTWFHNSTSNSSNWGTWNFGNGAFGSTQLTGTTYQDGNNQGIFKYQVPTGFYALCTKNLKTYG